MRLLENETDAAIVQLKADDRPVLGFSKVGISHAVLNEYETVWQPTLKNTGEEDHHWTWRAWLAMHPELIPLSLSCEGQCQAMMLLQKRDYMRGRREGGAPCSHVKFFASAPWNRSWIKGSPGTSQQAIKPAGSCLMLRAIEISASLGYNGRLSWCSLPGAVKRYRQMFPTIVTTGFDVEQQLDWYEIGTDAASDFRKRMEPFLGPCYVALDGGAK